MATFNQYMFFMRLYEEEKARAESWFSRCTAIFTIISIYIVLITFSFTHLNNDKIMSPKTAHIFVNYLFLFSFILIICGFSATVFVMFLRRYEKLIDPVYLIKNNYKAGLPKEDEFFDDIILDIALATKENKKQNDKRAIAFQIAAVTVFLGIVVHGLTLLKIIFN